MGKVAGTGGSVYGTKTDSGDASALTDAKAWSIRYDNVLEGYALTSGKLKLMSGDGTVSNEYYLWGDARGRISTDSLLSKGATSGLTLNYADVKSKGGFNIYGYKEQASGTGKDFRTVFTGLSTHSAWDTAKKALVVKYKEISDKFEIWYVIAEGYTVVAAGAGLCNPSDSNTWLVAPAANASTTDVNVC